MKLIPLYRKDGAKVAETKVDDDIFDVLNQHNWQLGANGYVSRCQYRGNQRGDTIYIHRVIMGTPKGKHTDHINGDCMDNQRANLRICTPSQNLMNCPKKKNNTSGHIGVSWDKQSGKWAAYLMLNYKKKNLGYFTDLKEAVEAREQAVKKFYGEFAYLAS